MNEQQEILFRGKRADNGEWVYGDCVHNVYKIGDICVGRYGCEVGLHQVDHSTIDRYTGLKDKNRKRVFTGDIIRFDDESNECSWIGVVVFGNPNCTYTWGYQLVHISGEKPNLDILLWFDMEEHGVYAEVVGNIHDNPEMLKQ